jgi:hypothetical protein
VVCRTAGEPLAPFVGSASIRELVPNAAVEGMRKVWNTWLTRAKGIVSRQLTSQAQAQLFFHLFPNRRSVKVKAEPDGTDDSSKSS